MEVKIISSKDDFLGYKTDDGIERIVHYSDLNELWSYATEEDQEGVCVYLQDNLIIGIMLVASAQGGIVFVWDANEHKLLHISDGSYSYAVLIHENFVYNLCVISNFVTPARFALGRCELGRLDAYKEFELIDCEFSCDVNDFDGDFGRIQLTHEGEDFFVILNGIKSKIDFNELHIPFLVNASTAEVEQSFRAS